MDFSEREPAEEQRQPSPDEVDLLTAFTRLGAGLVFLAALVAATVGWCLIGGTGHFEATAWYLKCGLCLGWAAAVTAGVNHAMREREGWRGSARRWIGYAILISIAMGCVTYYYHLQEPPDEEVLEEESTARL
jgi:hypothetical protein